jgi:hypothetical protein
LLNLAIALLSAALAVADGAAGQSFTPPAWGQVTSDLQVGIARSEPADLPEIEVHFPNPSQSGFLINLGVMLGNGRTIEPRAMSLIVTDQNGRVLAVPWARPFHVGGRLDDYPVALRPGATYSMRINLAEFRGRTALEHELHLEPGRYRLRLQFEGRKPFTRNTGMDGADLLNWWVGRAESGSIDLNVGQ